MYGTTDEFLRLFGLNRIAELPDLQVFAAKSLQEKQADLPFGDPLPPLGEPAIIPVEALEGEERLEALDASAPDPFFKQHSYNKGDLLFTEQDKTPAPEQEKSAFTDASDNTPEPKSDSTTDTEDK